MGICAALVKSSPPVIIPDRRKIACQPPPSVNEIGVSRSKCTKKRFFHSHVFPSFFVFRHCSKICCADFLTSLLLCPQQTTKAFLKNKVSFSASMHAQRPAYQGSRQRRRSKALPQLYKASLRLKSCRC